MQIQWIWGFCEEDEIRWFSFLLQGSLYLSFMFFVQIGTLPIFFSFLLVSPFWALGGIWLSGCEGANIVGMLVFPLWCRFLKFLLIFVMRFKRIIQFLFANKKKREGAGGTRIRYNPNFNFMRGSYALCSKLKLTLEARALGNESTNFHQGFDYPSVLNVLERNGYNWGLIPFRQTFWHITSSTSEIWRFPAICTTSEIKGERGK